MTDSANDDTTTVRTVRHPSQPASSPAPSQTMHLRPNATSPGTAPPSIPDPAPATELPDLEPTDDQPTRPLLYTAEQAAALLQVRTSWLRRKAAARAVPCRLLGKHLRFSLADIHTIAEASAQPSGRPRHSPTHHAI
jgi:hypothetical protein